MTVVWSARAVAHLEALRAWIARDRPRAAADIAATLIAAVELLADVQEPDVAGALQQLLHREEDQYIRQRTLSALAAMKASYGTF